MSSNQVRGRDVVGAAGLFLIKNIFSKRMCFLYVDSEGTKFDERFIGEPCSGCDGTDFCGS